jgi:hypothetical protein
MPRYRFNLINGSQVVVDPHGLEVQDETRLRRETVAALRELAQEEPELDWPGWRLEVLDEHSGRTAFSLAIEGFLASSSFTH